MKVNVGIIGLGVVSSIHISALESLSQVQIVAVCDIDGNKSRKTPKEATFYEDYHEMLEKEKLDVVHLCLPHYLHYEVAKECAKKGVNILCEKPSTINREQLKKMSRLDKDYDITLGICLQNRWNLTFLKLQELLASGRYGKILGLKAVAIWSRPESYYKQAPWRGKMLEAGGGCMINQAIHTLDQMQLIGGKIKSVKGKVCNLLDYDIEVEDTACAHITFEKGVRATFFGTISYVKNSSIELQVACEKGSFTIKDYSLWYADAEDETKKQLLIKDKQLQGSKAYYGASHYELIRDYYDSLAGNKNSYVSIEQEGKVILLIEAIRQSSLMNKEVLWKELK